MRPLIAIFFLAFAMLACGGLADSGITEANVRVTGLPQFICPTSTPVPTNTALPTLTQLPTSTQQIIPTPWVYATHPPTCNYSLPAIQRYACIPNACMWSSMSVCGVFTIRPTNTPSGFWSGGGVGYGATSTPRPTHTPRPTYTPYPTPTPYVISENYHMGADVYVGGEGGLQLRFRISNPRILTSGARQIVAWDVEIGNVGSIAYNALPGAQTFVSHIISNGQVREGQWYASAEAMRSAGLSVDERSLDIVRLEAGQSISLTLASFTPHGELYKIAWILDPYASAGGGFVGGNTALWVNQPDDNNCLGNIEGDFTIPTPSAELPTPTPSITPYVPPFWGQR